MEDVFLYIAMVSHSTQVSICEPRSLWWYCTGGISLSPAFVVMFVMQHYQLSWEDALHMVQNRRYCISPNGGFLTQIKVCHTLQLEPTNSINYWFFVLYAKEYEAIYRANVAVAAYPTAERTASRRKREADDDDDDDQRYVSSVHRNHAFNQRDFSEDDRKRALVKNDSMEIDPNAMET